MGYGRRKGGLKPAPNKCILAGAHAQVDVYAPEQDDDLDDDRVRVSLGEWPPL